MKNRMISYALLLGFTPFLVQCVASEQDLRGIDLRTRTLDNRVAELERLNETVRSQAAAQARLGSDLGGISDRLLQHQGRMDEADHQRLRLQEQQQEGQRATSIRLDNIDINLKGLTARLEELSQSLSTALLELQDQQQDNRRMIQEIQEQRAREAAERAAEAAAEARAAEQARREAEERARREAAERAKAAREAAFAEGPREIVPEQLKQKVEAGRPSAPDAAPESSQPPQREAAPPSPSPPQPAAPPSPAPGSKPEGGLYEQGRQQFKEQKYPEAYASLSRYLEQNSRGEWAGDARFLLGEALYQQQEFELAILEYQKLIADFPNHPRIPEALLRQGMAFEELREPSTAAIIYKMAAVEGSRSFFFFFFFFFLQKIRR